MESDFVDYEAYHDPIAARAQAYMWLLESMIGIKDNAPLFNEGMEMLKDIRLSIGIPDKIALKAIRGGK